jgi:hypothetical protein
MQKTPIIQQLLAILKTVPTKEQALHQMSAFFEQDEALAKTLASTLLIHTQESRQIYPLLGLEPPSMVDMQILAYLSAAFWHRVAKSVVRDRLTQQEQRE